MTYAGDITPQEAWELLEQNPEAVLVDVRTRAEWVTVGVPDTSGLGRPTAFIEWIRLPSRTVNPAFLAELVELGLSPGDGRPIVFLCRTGNRSIAAAHAATAAGLGPAYNVLEGFEGFGGPFSGWQAAGLPWGRA
jgi:rhodanese-related sulfurtransferase